MEEIGFQAKIKNPDFNYVGSKLLNAAVRKLCSPFLSPHNLRQTGTWLHRSEGLPLSNDPDWLVLQCCSAAFPRPHCRLSTAVLHAPGAAGVILRPGEELCIGSHDGDGSASVNFMNFVKTGAKLEIFVTN